ncbi:MAG TPA: alkaline phosphatase family protein, partial [Candidatus Dormibacteraeota bacterium]|nr:alkaline phosphatase family protein [Candidatus Dormibacteraeota bacterium]
MLFRSVAAGLLPALVLGASAPLSMHRLPNQWRLEPVGRRVAVSTMPQGIALSPDGRSLAVVDGGALPAELQIVDTRALKVIKSIKLPDAFGSPVWLSPSQVVVAGGNSDRVDVVDTQRGTFAGVDRLARGSWCAGVALSPHGSRIAAIGDRDGLVTLFDRDGSQLWSAPTGAHPSALAFGTNGDLFVASRSASTLRVFSRTGALLATLSTGFHPAALLLLDGGRRIAVAAGDAGEVDIFSAHRPYTRKALVDVALRIGVGNHFGSSPDALATMGDGFVVSLAGENQIAFVRDNRVIARLPVGWYPDALAASKKHVFVADAKGDGMHPNPAYRPFTPGAFSRYVAVLTSGDIRKIPLSLFETSAARSGAAVLSTILPLAPRAQQSVLRAGGPIHHVIYVIKENRSYDQVLGDIKRANGDPKIAWFGENVTPNQHALARQFGIFDNAYTDAQVSADGHNWTDAAFANDFVQRFWPPNYGGRRTLYDFQNGAAPVASQGGFIWDDAARAGITFRDYGEDANVPPSTSKDYLAGNMPGLVGHIDERYEGWNLSYSDVKREAEWAREFQKFIASGDLPALEIVYFPNDHSASAKAGFLTPEAFVAQNDVAVGRLVDEVSHSRYWKSTAIFIVEDDAQNGPDHVSDQRSTFYVATPYARGGVINERISTSSVLRSIELI